MNRLSLVVRDWRTRKLVWWCLINRSSSNSSMRDDIPAIIRYSDVGDGYPASGDFNWNDATE